MPYNYIPELASKYSSVGNTLSTLNMSLTSLDSSLYTLSANTDILGIVNAVDALTIDIDNLYDTASVFSSFSGGVVSNVASISANLTTLTNTYNGDSILWNSVVTTVNTNSATWNGNDQIFVTSGTWTNPSPLTRRPVHVKLVGAGGGGGGGKSNSGDAGGGAGGAGGAVVEFWTFSDLLNNTQTVTVGIRGVGGVGGGVGVVLPGTKGGDTIFASITAIGGNGGAFGINVGTVAGGTTVVDSSSDGWITLTNAAGGTGGSSNAVTPILGATLGWLPTGGGGGGGADVSGARDGSNGSAQGSSPVIILGGPKGTVASVNGGNGQIARGTGTGGGGGASSNIGGVFGGNGGNGGGYGGGGGGGGGYTGGGGLTQGGNGGNGGGGYAHIIVF